MGLLKSFWRRIIIGKGLCFYGILLHNPAEVEGLNLTTNKREAFPCMIQGRHGTGLVLYQGHLFVSSGCGNRGGNPELTTMEKMKLN